MPNNMHMTKVPEYPRPHEKSINFSIPIESAVATKSATIIPIINYDEGLGAMSAYESNPQNSSFVEYAGPNCFPTSRIDKVFCQLRVNMSKIMLETDKVHAVSFATMKIHTSFNEGALALDELSTLDCNEILELLSESTDRQTHPLYNAVDLPTFKTGGNNMGADQIGLDTDLKIEGVTFLHDDYYDALHYYTNGDKLKSIQDGLVWHTLSRQKPFLDLRFTQDASTKFMNPYAFLGVLIYVPNNNEYNQYGKAGDTTVETSVLEYTFKYRYNEYNHEFNHNML